MIRKPFPSALAALAGLSAALLVPAFAAPAHADERFQVGIGGGAHFVPMDSMDSLTSSSAYGVFRMDASLALPEVSLIPGYRLEAGLRWDSGQLDGTTYNRVESSMELDTLVATGKLRRALIGSLSGFAEAQIGLQWASLQLSDAQSSSARPLHGNAKAAVAGIGGGAELTLDRGAHGFHLGFRIDAHYQLASSMEFAATPMSAGEDTLELETRASSLGSINSSGMRLGMSLIGRF